MRESRLITLAVINTAAAMSELLTRQVNEIT